MVAHVDDSRLKMTYGSYRFNPAPLMNFEVEPLKTNAGERLADQVTLTFNGTLLNLDDLSSGDASQMIARQTLLMNALSGDGQEFRLLHHINSTAAQGTPIMSGIYPRVEGLAFDEGTWWNQINYSFSLIYETNMVSGAVPIESYTDNWEFQEDESNRTIRATHSVNAVGINTRISGGLTNASENARTWVNARMNGGLPSGAPAFADSGTLGTPLISLQKYRQESMSETDGAYSAREDITIASGHYANNATVQLQQDEAGITTVTVNGNIEGLGRFDTAIDHAVSGWNNWVQPRLSDVANSAYTEFSGINSTTLNVSKVKSLSVTRDTFNGRVGYSTSYNDDPRDNLPSGIAEFSISKQIKLPIRKMVAFEIPSRIAGSVVHDIGTPTDGNITINGTAQGVIDTQLNYVKDYCEDQINILRPNSALYNQLWFTDFSQTENVEQKSFSFNVVWSYTDNLTSVPSPSGEISF